MNGSRDLRLRYLINIAIVLAIGLGVGGVTAWMAVKAENSFGSVKIGQWTSWPLAGNVDSDPYTRARVARDGSVPLGAGEGLALFLTTDQFGKPLDRKCQYKIVGATPPARLWTLSVQDNEKQTVLSKTGVRNTAFSQTLLRAQDGTFSINIGSQPAPGNWLSISGTGKMRLVIRLYDTPITGSAGLAEPVMPQIFNRDCIL